MEISENDCLGWLGKPPTSDELEILTWMKSRRMPRRILHVGVGNGVFSEWAGKRVTQAITKDGGEASHWRSRGLDTLLCNKYAVSSYVNKLSVPFDCIIDVNIRSYACCDLHFGLYMAEMLKSLRWDGRLLTNLRGLGYLKPTAIRDLKKLCPLWRVRQTGNIVVMTPGVIALMHKWRPAASAR